MATEDFQYISPNSPIEYSVTLRGDEGVSGTGWLASQKTRAVQTVLAETVLRRGERITKTAIPPFGRSLFTRSFVAGPPGSVYAIASEIRQPETEVTRTFDVAGILNAEGMADHVTPLVGGDAPVQWESIGVVGRGPSSAGFARELAPDAASPLPPTETREKSLALDYPVWFGTHRTPVVRGDQIIDFASGRSDIVRFGKCVVSIPRSHQLGSLGSSPLRRWWTRIDDRLTVKTLDTMGEQAFWDQIKDVLNDTIESERDAVVFLHGYRTKFKDAARRAGQLGVDLGIGGVMAFYSWPSRGTLIHYPADTAAIESSEGVITSFLKNIVVRSGAKRVHLIAHSMGNRGLLRAVNNIAAAAQSDTKVPFNQIVIAAADVDLDTFKSLSSAYSSVAQRTTMYVCPADVALYVSRAIYRAPRAGFTPPTVVVPGVDTVDVPHFNLWNLGHGYFAEARELLVDLKELFHRGSAPDLRPGLTKQITPTGTFWRLAK
jgi:esterase/lipase superfamily enzyme